MDVVFLYMFHVALLSVFSASSLHASEFHEPANSEECLLFVNEEGNIHEMNFSTLPNEVTSRGYGDAYFYLYTRRNPDTPEELNIPKNENEMTSEYFNCKNDIKVLTHGWMSDDQTKWLQYIKNEFITYYDLNVIVIDWSELAKNPVYPWSALCTRYVGKKLAKLLNAINQSYQIQNSRVHLIGHSLGAQVMGYAGMFSSARINRITGLDPARPLFELPPMQEDFRLEKTDAEFVDIIHTCGGVYGYKYSHGHADFYPNSGKPQQPGCQGIVESANGCSHGRSCEFFGESIASSNYFVAHNCEDWDQYNGNNGVCKEETSRMGYYASGKDRGNFYLYTRNDSRYSCEAQ